MEAEGRRLNKYISEAGVASRREADRLIEAGKVEIRRKSRKDEPEKPTVRASVGDRVFHGDTVFVNGRELPKKEQEKLYYLYNKPRGVVCTLNREIENNLADAIDFGHYLTYAGRLDKDSSGLMILTNDGELSDRIMRASQYHEKEYVVTVGTPLTAAFIQQMSEGVKIHLDDETTLRRHPDGIYVTTRPCRVRKLGERKFAIVLTQGFNRQIRRMCKALGYTVSSIERIRIMNLRLADLKPGDMRSILPEELAELKKRASKTGSQYQGREHAGKPARSTAGRGAGDKTSGRGAAGRGNTDRKERSSSAWGNAGRNGRSTAGRGKKSGNNRSRF